MTGVGTHLYNDGRFALGNSTSNIVFNGTNAYLNGFTATAAFSSTGGSGVFWPANTQTYQEYSNVATLNPTAFTVSNVAGFTSGSTYFGGVALPDGRVVFAGTQGTVIQIYNYITNSFSSTISSPILTGSIYGSGATLVPDGRVIFAPRNTTSGSVGVLDTMSPAPREFCLHPFFNKA
jgi:hypothetical protein